MLYVETVSDHHVIVCIIAIVSIPGVIYFKVVATNPIAPLGSVSLSTAVILKVCVYLITIAIGYCVGSHDDKDTIGEQFYRGLRSPDYHDYTLLEGSLP